MKGMGEIEREEVKRPGIKRVPRLKYIASQGYTEKSWGKREDGRDRRGSNGEGVEPEEGVEPGGTWWHQEGA